VYGWEALKGVVAAAAGRDTTTRLWCYDAQILYCAVLWVDCQLCSRADWCVLTSAVWALVLMHALMIDVAARINSWCKYHFPALTFGAKTL
jgi:hypothetical protein